MLWFHLGKQLQLIYLCYIFKEECIESRNNTELKYGVVYLLNDSLKNNTVSHRIQYNLEFSLM